MSILTVRPFLVCPRCGARHSGAVVPGQRSISAICADCARLSRRATVTHRRVPRSWPALLAAVTRWGLLAAAVLFAALMLARSGGW